MIIWLTGNSKENQCLPIIKRNKIEIFVLVCAQMCESLDVLTSLSGK